jgi:hypothetical protein
VLPGTVISRALEPCGLPGAAALAVAADAAGAAATTLTTVTTLTAATAATATPTDSALATAWLTPGRAGLRCADIGYQLVGDGMPSA